MLSPNFRHPISHHDWTSHAADAFRYGALLQRLLPRAPAMPVGWRERDSRANAVWPPLEWGTPEYPRTVEDLVIQKMTTPSPQ